MKKLFLNARKPQGFSGKLMLWIMSLGHAAMARWGLRQLTIKSDDKILDVGCGGGSNIAQMLRLAPDGKVCGLDYSALCATKSQKRNRSAVVSGRSEIKEGSVAQIPWPDGAFDLVTAFETVYFWPDFASNLKEVRRILKPGGKVFICNEAVKSDGGEAPHQGLVKLLDMKIYSPEDFKAALGEAGFAGVDIRQKGSWICVIAGKDGDVGA